MPHCCPEGERLETAADDARTAAYDAYAIYLAAAAVARAAARAAEDHLATHGGA